MKKLRKYSELRSLFLLYVMFSLLFPYGIFAAETEKSYKVPKNSISYFVEENSGNQVNIVAPPAAQNIEKPSAEPISESASPAPEPLEEEAVPAATAMPEKVTDIEAKKPEKALDKMPEKAKKAPIVVQKIQKTEEAVKADEPTLNRSFSPDPFKDVLARMQRRSEQRKAEAEKLGIVLPSQGGDMSAVSPSLSKLNGAIKEIVNRHKCSSSGHCSFCR
ncbi:MAG: hypothetical protein ACOYXC_22275 [Candidatus Rifleibacteriota bacterium]